MLYLTPMLLLWAQLLLHMLSWEPNYPVRCELIVAITPYKFCFSFPCIFVMCGTTCSNTQVKYKGLATPCVCSQLLHRVFATTGTRAWQAPLSREFCRQEYWGRLLFSTPGDLPHPGIKPAFLASPALAGGFFTTAPPGKPVKLLCSIKFHWTNDF